MRMTIRQLSELIEGEVVAEKQYSADSPSDLIGVLTLVLHNCSDLLQREDIPISQTAINLRKLEFTHPEVAGRLEALFEDPAGS